MEQSRRMNAPIKSKGADHGYGCTPMSDIDFRSVGFTDAAINHPRGELALVMFAAFNGVSVNQLPEAMRYFPNEATGKAWTRVAEAAASFLGGGGSATKTIGGDQS